MSYRYTPNGRLLEMRYPDDRSLSYTLDNYDRIITQKDANQTEQHFVYKPEDKGRLSSLKVKGSEINFHYGEDDNGQHGKLIKRTTNAEATGVTQTHLRYGVFGQMVESISANPKAHYGVSYNYNPRGELLKQVQSLAEKGQLPRKHTTEYRYDGMQRLTDEVHTDQATSFQKRYRYDGNNNLLAEEDHSNCGPGQSLQYSYNNLDQLTHVKVGEVIKPVLHDANGHLTQDHKATQYEYDDAGFLLQVQPQQKPATRYEYGPNGLLSHRTRGDSQSHFYPDHHKNMQTLVKDGQWRSLVRHGKNIVGRQTEQGLDQFFKVNESTGVVLQQTKGETQLSLHRYDAYGKPLQRNQTNDTEFTWNQELTEPETGLTYLRHRFHHPELRRFITRDNLHIDNRYAYAHGDPVNYVDPMGHLSKKLTASIVMAVVTAVGLLLSLPSLGASDEAAAAANVTTGATVIDATGFYRNIAGYQATWTFLQVGFLTGAQKALDSGNKEYANNLIFVSKLIGGFEVASVVGSAPAIVLGVLKIAQTITSITSKVGEAVSGMFREATSAAEGLEEGESETSQLVGNFASASDTKGGKYLNNLKGDTGATTEYSGFKMKELNQGVIHNESTYTGSKKVFLDDVSSEEGGIYNAYNEGGVNSNLEKSLSGGVSGSSSKMSQSFGRDNPALENEEDANTPFSQRMNDSEIYFSVD